MARQLQFTMLIEQDENNVYAALEEVRRRIKEAIELVLESNKNIRCID